MRSGPLADRRLDPAALHPDGHLDQLEVAGPIQDGVGGGLADGQNQVVDNITLGGRPAAAARCFWTARRSPARRQPRRPATARSWRCGRHGLVGGPAGPGSTAPLPCGPGIDVTPAQPPPAAAPPSRHRHGPLLAGRCRPSSSPWPATAGPAPPPAVRCRAPGTAGRRGCRTAHRGCRTPGSANRRSAGCTDRHRQALASSCTCGPC